MIETAFFHAEMVSTENFFHDVNTDRFFLLCAVENYL